ncbi:Rrf2 family transcriptional regulator [Brevundimonas mediterranea]|uniref:DNA-binding IscR family transcriptional regulator n=1 Tax=Brevundimonas mediterranea TaxID=74329 RepID=A0A7W6A701_9CAUL|nr:Rrf2 family transcriptional regulator [Brevundimonas mediterranea]MBB3872805.1 DNA-binding IscR family transcriptional regulator [Brevundimonas mediterranea]
MKRDSRLSNILHALLHMAEHEARTGAPMTSDQLAVCLSTNPVVVRRTMAGLREQGLVASEKGHGGGWRLALPLDQVTLGQVNMALGEPGLFPEAPPVEADGCLVEAAVNDALAGTYAAARALLVARLNEITLADLAADFARRMADHPKRDLLHAHRHPS